jgi:uncharacterized membrane protein (DUF485 family)
MMPVAVAGLDVRWIISVIWVVTAVAHGRRVISTGKRQTNGCLMTKRDEHLTNEPFLNTNFTVSLAMVAAVAVVAFSFVIAWISK